MLFFKLFILLLICLERKEISAERNRLCQAMVIEECSNHSQGLLKAIERGNRPLLVEECYSLQATINCLSVPRCPGNLLRAFRYYVLTTAAVLKKSTDTCSKLDVTSLERYVKGLKMVCEDNKRIKDGCDRRCKCEDGDLVSCYRVRKEFTRMSLEERKRFIQAVKLASSDPQYRSEYEKLTTFHSRVPSEFLHHMPQIFLPWHRWFVLEFENFLREIDCRITIPYWDWSKDAEHWTRGSEIRDVWNPSLHGLGGNGVLPDKCVMNGPFKKGEFSLPRSTGGGCLKRDFNFSTFCNLPNAEDARSLLKLEDFAAFEEKIREIFHAKFHDCVGEHMHCHQTSASTPEFWLHHGFLDKLWVDWQNKGNANKFQYYLNISITMPGSDRFPWEYLDVDDLPGDARVLYENVYSGPSFVGTPSRLGKESP